MAVLEGDMREVHYHAEPDPSEPEKVVLTEDRTAVYHKGQVAFIRDEIALHKVVPAGPFRGCTLHMYSKPIPMANIYCPKTGKVMKRKMGFFSRRGVQAQECPLSACSNEYVELAKYLCKQYTNSCKSLSCTESSDKDHAPSQSPPCQPSYLSLLLDACGDEISAPEVKHAALQ